MKKIFNQKGLKLIQKLIFYQMIFVLIFNFGLIELGALEPLIISNIEIVSTDKSATITWLTNRPADGLIEYGLKIDNYPFYLRSGEPKNTSHAITLFGLQPDTTYYFRIKSSNGTEEAISSARSFKTQKSQDREAPKISRVQIAYITGTTATIQWETDEPADSQIYYGKTNQYGSVRSDGAKVTIHDLTLGGLNPGTLYHFLVKSKDKDNNQSIWYDMTFQTLPSNKTDKDELIIYDVKPVSVNDPNITETTAAISWRTNKLAEGWLRYGLTSNYGQTLSTSLPRDFSHSITLSGLKPNTTYYFEIEVRDVFGKKATAKGHTFTTKGKGIIEDEIQVLGSFYEEAWEWYLDEGEGVKTFNSLNEAGELKPNYPTDSPTWIKLPKGYALEFDGNNDYLQLPGENIQDLSSGTISLWIKRYEIDTSVSGRHPNYEIIDGFFSKQHNWVNSFLVFGFDKNETKKLRFQVSNGNGLKGNNELPLEVWIHVATSWDSNSIKLYVNGILDNEIAKGANLPTDNSPLSVGAWYNHGEEYFKGAIDNLKIFKRALDSSEIYNLYLNDYDIYYGQILREGEPKILGASILDYTPASALYKTEDSPDVYAILNGQRHYITSPSAFLAYGYRWQDIKIVSQKTLDLYPEAKLLKTPDDNTIYYLYTRPNKRWFKIVIPSPSVFISYPKNFWGNIVIVDKIDLNAYQNAYLIKTTDSPAVYLLENNIKRPFASAEIFEALGYHWSEIVEVNQTHLDSYPTGEVIK